MANDLTSNITRKVMRAFIPAIEKQRVLSKTVNTQVFQGEFNPSSGDYVDIKRPHQFKAKQTATGDISALTQNDIIAGKATATVQNYITVDIGWSNKEEALSLDQLEEILKPAAEECVTVLETNLCDFMIQNAALSTGTPGTVIDAWSDVAAQMSLMKSIGVPMGEIYSVMNPFTIQNLASAQTGLSADPSRLVQTAWEMAQISTPFAGLRAVTSNSLSTWTSSDAADRDGALSADATATYLAAKDTMTQSLAVTGLTASATVKAGDILEFTGTGSDARTFCHQKTHKPILGADGAPVKWRCTVTADVTLDGSGEGTLVVTGPAIYESGGAYDNISAALVTSDAFSILGEASTEYQPNLFYHKDAFGVAFVKLPKLYSTDTVATTSDGLSIRVSKYSDGDANTQKIRFDLLPAFAVMNPFFAGKGFGYQ